MTQVNLPNSQAHALVAAMREAGLATPSTIDHDTPGRTTLTWTPDLSPADVATAQTMQTLIVGAMLITPAERTAIQSDIDGLITYQGIATPTLVQTAAAVKAQSRILRAIFRS